jgi:uncharacterized membrane protein (DUF2068 family)
MKSKIEVPLTKRGVNRQLEAGMQTVAQDAHAKDRELDPEAEARAAQRQRDERGLWIVGLFKLSKAIFFSAVGAGALHMVHRNIGDVVMRLVEVTRIDPESHFVGLVMDRADLIGHHQLRQAGILAFLYAALCVVEGTGLMLRKSWAEYFTVALTAAFLPWESYELIARFAAYKILFLVVNIVVLLYLLWVLKRKREAAGLGMESGG